VNAARFELIASFDDDSYPIDSDYFERALKVFDQFPDASVIAAAVCHLGESIGLDARSAQWTADFSGCACLYRRQAFLEAGGYVPLPVAYGMEEVDLAIRLHSRARKILGTPWLRVFHETDLKHHEEPHITAGSIANLALLAYLRYPVSLWGIGVGQCANRLLWLLRHGRTRGIVKGVTMIPGHVWENHQYRAPVSKKVVRSYLALRRAPVEVHL
jgi:GT2 family glycosyltransferase